LRQSAPQRGIVCTLIGMTNDVAGSDFIVFQLSSSYDEPVLVGIEGIEVQDSLGWGITSKGPTPAAVGLKGRKHFSLGVAPNGKKSFSFPAWTNDNPWRLRLFYSSPDNLAKAATREAMLREQGGGWVSQAQIVISSPVVQ